MGPIQRSTRLQLLPISGLHGTISQSLQRQVRDLAHTCELGSTSSTNLSELADANDRDLASTGIAPQCGDVTWDHSRAVGCSLFPSSLAGPTIFRGISGRFCQKRQFATLSRANKKNKT